MISFGEKYFSDDGEYVTEIICITNSLEESTATTTVLTTVTTIMTS